MKALVARGPGNFQLEDVPEPIVVDGGRLIEVEAAGVCAIDRMLWRGDGPWQPSWPMVPGHELLGHDLETGERITVEVKLPCGDCRWCLAGRDNICPQARHLGSSIPGAFADLVALPAGARVHVVPDDLAMESAVLAEPMACALHAVRRAALPARATVPADTTVPADRTVLADRTVAILGLGPIGALAMYAARAEGAGRVVAVTRTPDKAALARDLGADEAIDVTAGALDLADVVVDCSGDPAAAVLALDLVLPGGTVVLSGVYRAPALLDLNQVAVFKELTVIGAHLAPGCFPDAIAMLPWVDSGLIVSAVRLLDDFRGALEPSKHPRLKEMFIP